MNKLHQILLGVLVAQLALVGVVFWPRSNSAGASGAALFPNVKAEDVQSLTVTEKTGTTATFVRQGDKWVYPDGGNYPADSNKINTLLGKVVALKNNRLVTKTVASQAQLQVADKDFASRLDFKTAAGQTYTLFVGSGSGGTDSHVRVGGQNEVYLASGISSYDVQANVGNWIDATYLSVAQADITALTLKNANGEFAFTKDAAGKWQLAGLPAGQQVNENNLSTILSIAASLRMNRPLGKQDQPAYGMAQPGAVLTLKTKTNNQDKTITLQVGARDAKDNTYVLKSSESEYYVRADEYVVKDLVEKKQADFIQQPTPAPAAGTPTAP